MVTKTVAIYVFFDDILKSMNHKEPEIRKTSDAEIITVVLIATRYFAGNIEKSICFVRSTGLMPDMLGKSHFNRRLYNIGEFLSQLFSIQVMSRNLSGSGLFLKSNFLGEKDNDPNDSSLRKAPEAMVQGEHRYA